MRAVRSPFRFPSLVLFLAILSSVALSIAPLVAEPAEPPGAEPSAESSAGHVLTLDPAETTVDFWLEATGHDVEGHLFLTSGRLEIGPTGGEGGRASGELVIDARRAETGNRRRDRKMHGEVLESEAHPLIVFHAQRFAGSFPGADVGEVRLVGEMELLGRRHPVELPVHYALDGGSFTADATFDVPFIEWGLHDPSIFLLKVDEVVQVTVHARGNVASSTGSSAAVGAGGAER